jgi:hypothetical protein
MGHDKTSQRLAQLHLLQGVRKDENLLNSSIGGPVQKQIIFR